MWEDIILRTRHLGGKVWCVIGDFNFVCFASERVGVGGRIRPSDSVDFY